MDSYLNLQKLYIYIKKAVNTKLKIDTLNLKLNRVDELYNSIITQIVHEKNQLEEIQLNEILTNSAKWHKEIVYILKLKLELALKQKHNKLIPYAFKVGKVKTNEMALPSNSQFDIKQATAIVQPYDGSADNLDSFVDAASLLKEYVSDAQMEIALKFLKTRLNGKARVGLPLRLTTIDELINDVKRRCQDQQTPDNLLAKFKNIKQRTDTNSLCDEVDNLTIKLKSIYIQQGIPDDVAQLMTTRSGVDALMNNVNSETRIILKAGNFSNIKEATQKVQENAPQNQQQILTINDRQQKFYGRNRYSNRMNNNTARQNNFRGRVNNLNNNLHRRNYQHQNNFRGRINYQRPFNHQNVIAGYRERRGPPRRLYTMQAEHPVQEFIANNQPCLPIQQQNMQQFP